MIDDTNMNFLLNRQWSNSSSNRFSSRFSTNSYPGADDITRVELPNGIVILTRPNFDSHSITLSGYLEVGGLIDPEEKLGLADFTAFALMRGTKRRDFQEIFNVLESAGASLGFTGSTHTTGFGGKALAEDLDLLLESLADPLRYPIFPDEQVEKLRSQLLTSLAIRAQDTHQMAAMAFDQIVYKDHPYSRPEDGYPETIMAISKDDLVEFHRMNYGPRGMVITVVGAVEPSEVVGKISHYFGDWENSQQPIMPALPELEPLNKKVVQSVNLVGKSQSDVMLGVAGPSRCSPDYLAASLGNNILGQFGMMGRIGDIVREQAGLAYYASSSLQGGVGPGPWRISAGVAPVNVDTVIALISQELFRFINEPVTAEELADSQANFIGRLPLSLESNGGVAGALLTLERYNLGLDYYRNYQNLLMEITREDVLGAAQHYLHPDRLGIAVAGPQ
jgi:zinc protease